MLFQRRTNYRWLILIPIGILILIGGGVALSRGRPRVTDIFPPPDAVAIPGLAPVRVAFSRPMNWESVTQNLDIQPRQAGDTSWDGDTLTFNPTQPWPGGETVTVRLSTAARASIGLPLAEPQTWSFTVARTMLAYLWPSDHPANLYMLDPISGDTIRLTETNGVLDFSVSPDSLHIYFSAQNDSGGAGILHLDMLTRQTETLLDCGAELCSAPQISPNGEWLAYENITQTQIWLLPLPAGESSPSAESTASEARPPTTSAGMGVRPIWSPEGLLAFYDPAQAVYRIFDPDSGETKTFPNETGEPGAWAPDGRTFIAPEIIPAVDEETLPASHLFSFIYVNGIMIDLSRGDNVEDNSPTFSPDGTLLAFARKFLDVERWTPGRQLWLMTPNGTAARPITNAPLYTHSAFAWHPNGTQIAYVRSNQATLDEPPEIWLTNRDGSEQLRLLIGGYNPQWIP